MSPPLCAAVAAVALLAAPSCTRWGTDEYGTEPDTLWAIDRITDVIGVGPETGDAFAIFYEIDPSGPNEGPHSPTLVRLAGDDGTQRWSVALPEIVLASGSPSATMAGDAIIVNVDATAPFVIGDVELPGTPTLLRFSPETGALVSATTAPANWGAGDNVVGYADGAVAGSFGGDSVYAPIELVDATGLRWSTTLPDDNYVKTMAFASDGDVVTATQQGVFRLAGADGALTLVRGAADVVTAAVAADDAIYTVDLYARVIRAWYASGEPWWEAAMDERCQPSWLDVAPDGRLVVRGSYSEAEDRTARTVIAVLDRTTGANQGSVELQASQDNEGDYVTGIVGGPFGRIYIGGRRLRVVELP